MLERPFQGLHFSSVQKNLGPEEFLGGRLRNFWINVLAPSLRDTGDALARIPLGLLYSANSDPHEGGI